MRINGIWVGWGLGDNSTGDMTVRNFKAFARRMYKRYMGDLADTNLFDEDMYEKMCLMQDRLVNSGQLIEGQFIRGVLDLDTQYATTFKHSIPILPIIFTVEGHMSNMFVGPTASVAQTLENQGLCHWKPVFYDCTSLPFHNGSGVQALTDLYNSKSIEGPVDSATGKIIMWDFGPNVRHAILGFSQGSMVISAFAQDYLIPNVNGRLTTFTRGLAFGNPNREKNKEVPWARSPARKNTMGVMGEDEQFITTGTVLEGRWAEHANTGDMFAENGTDQEGQYKTAIAKIITENKWTGGTTSIVAQVLHLLGNIPTSMFPAVMAAISAILFLARNPNPHYSTIADPGDIEWIRGGLLAA